MKDPYITELFLPIYIPDSLIKLNVPFNIMNNAIEVFNKKNKEEPLSIPLSSFKSYERMVVSQILRENDDLFLKVSIPSISTLSFPKLRADLVGYVVIDKNSGDVEDLVIEGFKFVKKRMDGVPT